ncbi:hypothetical protein U3A59_18455 [Algoriphagus sp. E1-3-M2]|nr:hypothetical protein [Algoriphagus sp. E1-3-M2]
MKKNTDLSLSQIQKAHSVGSVVTMISFIVSVLIGRINGLEFLIIPLIIIVSLTTIGSTYFFIKSLKHKEKIEKPLNNSLSFIVRILINLAILILILL